MLFCSYNLAVLFVSLLPIFHIVISCFLGFFLCCGFYAVLNRSSYSHLLFSWIAASLACTVKANQPVCHNIANAKRGQSDGQWYKNLRKISFERPVKPVSCIRMIQSTDGTTIISIFTIGRLQTVETSFNAKYHTPDLDRYLCSSRSRCSKDVSHLSKLLPASPRVCEMNLHLKPV